MQTYAGHNNLLLNTDSYKASHWRQYPPGADGMFCYIEARGGNGEFPQILFFGLQAVLQEALAVPITHADVDEAAALLTAHGEPFHEAGWRRIVTEFGGRLPLRIRAVREGEVLTARQALVTVEATDAQSFWLASYIETWLLRLWYPVTVATQSWTIKQLLRDFLEKTADDAEASIGFKLHDFGARGVAANEVAGLGGCAHLVNFLGTDTVQALVAARRYYDEALAGFSIPAAEHSTMTSWQRDGEVDAYRNMIVQFGLPGQRFAVVSDSYNLWDALEMWGTQLKQDIIASGATLVVRPDSGDPAPVVLRTAFELEKYFGSTLNSKGYRVLNHVRILQGDGVNRHSIREILANLALNGFSTDNIAFGMGGALLQQLNRDTLGFAMKCSALRVNGVWREVFKDPVTDPGKSSRKGRLGLFRQRHSGEYRTVAIGLDNLPQEPLPGVAVDWEDALQTVYENGVFQQRQTLRDIRARADAVRGLTRGIRFGSKGFLLI